MSKFVVVGAGTMGRGIAETALAAGFDVTLLDASHELAEKGRAAIEKSLSRGVEKGRLTAENAALMLARLTVGADYSLAAGAEVAVEAVYEDMAVKQKVLSALSAAVGPDALIGSNTSSLSISKMSEYVRHPGRFLGIHFFNPVPVMKLVEVVPGSKTAPEAVQSARQLTEKLGKTPVSVSESPGFVVNRLLCPMMNEAAYLVMDGVASPEDIDTAMKLGANHPIGPLALADLVGIDVLHAIMQVLHSDIDDPKFRPCPLLKTMIDEGRLGRKSGRGFFTY
ncbi:MAG: 3-hydroxyacyl-CoA dehydrogenase family protein [Bacillota bacterium]